jgi:hypothetical protein
MIKKLELCTVYMIKHKEKFFSWKTQGANPNNYLLGTWDRRVLLSAGDMKMGKIWSWPQVTYRLVENTIKPASKSVLG